MPLLHPRLAELMVQTHSDLRARGDLPGREALRSHYETFRERFGPDMLRGLSGEPLLQLMKGNGRDALIYWLEFKDDEEFPAAFGSIAGGSALKYGIYRRRETGAWMTGHPHAQREISVADAIQIATAHRDQLLAASDLLEALGPNAEDASYRRLQRELERVSADVQGTSWGHKYLSLIHYTKLDDYHVEAYQQFHLIKALQRPVADQGRYSNAGQFVALATELEWPLNHLTTVMNRRNGPPHRYWRIGTRSGSTHESFWDMMRATSVVAIGWDRLGDLSRFVGADDFKER